MASNPINASITATGTYIYSVDWRDSPNGYAYEAVFNAGASGSVTVDTTLDNVNDPSVTPVWTTGTALTSTTSGTIGSPVQFIRLSVNSLSGGTINFKILEGAPDNGNSSGGGGSTTSDVNLVQVGGAAISEGQKTSANSLPVVLASDQSAIQVVGNVAAGVADSGNPVKVAGVYNSTPPTLTTGQRTDLQTGSAGSLKVQLAANNSANAIAAPTSQTDATTNSTVALSVQSFPIVFNGTTWDRQRSIQGVTSTGIGVAAVETAGSNFSNIKTNTTTLVKTGTGTLHRITVNSPGTTATITVYDNTTATGTTIATVAAIGTAPLTLPYDVFFSTGLTVVTTGTPDITVVYR